MPPVDLSRPKFVNPYLLISVTFVVCIFNVALWNSVCHFGRSYFRTSVLRVFFFFFSRRGLILVVGTPCRSIKNHAMNTVVWPIYSMHVPCSLMNRLWLWPGPGQQTLKSCPSLIRSGSSLKKQLIVVKFSTFIHQCNVHWLDSLNVSTRPIIYLPTNGCSKTSSGSGGTSKICLWGPLCKNITSLGSAKNI